MGRSDSFKSHGNSLVEYALPLGVVILVVFVAASTIGPSLNRSLTRQLGNTNVSMSQKELQVRQLGINPSFRNLRITMDDGTVLELPEFASDINGLLETDGANGGIKKLLADLDTLIAALEAAGKTDEANSLRNLANKGHRLAAWLNTLEAAVSQTGGNRDQLLGTTISFEGQTFTQGQIATLFELGDAGNTRRSFEFYGTDEQTIENRRMIYSEASTHQSKYPPELLNEFAVFRDYSANNRDGLDFIGSEYASFLTAYQEASQGSAMRDSQIKRVVNNLANNIFAVSSSFNEAYLNSSDPTLTFPPGEIENKVASTVSHYNSTGICNVGGDQDSGIQCL